jgi:hypothetical protein
LKARFPSAKGSSGHRLFLSVFMISSKVICDDTYSNKSWVIVGQNLFALREVNQMEREMCAYLEWELNVDAVILKEFQENVLRDFTSETGPYPTYVLNLKQKSSKTLENPSTITNSSSPIPNFAHTRPAQPALSVSTVTSTLRPSAPSTVSSSTTSPSSASTPSPSYTANTSPANSASPTTPNNYSPIHPQIYAPGPHHLSLKDSSSDGYPSAPSSKAPSRENSIETWVYRPRPDFIDASNRAMASMEHWKKTKSLSAQGSTASAVAAAAAAGGNPNPTTKANMSEMAFNSMEWRKPGDWTIRRKKDGPQVIPKKEDGSVGVYAYACPAVW